jgi:hypothetical protein
MHNPPFGFGEIIVELPKVVKDQKVNLNDLKASKINKMNQFSLVVSPPPPPPKKKKKKKTPK